MRTLLLLSTLVLLPVAAGAQPAVPAVPPARNTAPAAMTPAPAARSAAPTVAPAPVTRAPSADDPPTSDAVSRPATTAPVASAAPRPSASVPAVISATPPSASDAPPTTTAASAPPTTTAVPSAAPPSASDMPPTTASAPPTAAAAAASAPPTTEAAPTTSAASASDVPSPDSLQTVARNYPLTPEGNAAFLASYAARPDVTKLPGGTMYRVLVAGKGKSKPLGRLDQVSVSYRGWLVDGTSFDSSPVGTPRTFQLAILIPGWRDALYKMQIGDVFEIAIPADQAYGPEGRPGRIPPNQALIFVVSLGKVEYSG